MSLSLSPSVALCLGGYTGVWRSVKLEQHPFGMFVKAPHRPRPFSAHCRVAFICICKVGTENASLEMAAGKCEYGSRSRSGSGS